MLTATAVSTSPYDGATYVGRARAVGRISCDDALYDIRSAFADPP